MEGMAFSSRVIPSGGSVTLDTCRLCAVEGKTTDQWGRNFDSPPGGIADYGEGTAPHLAGTVTASEDSVLYLNFD